MRTKKYWQDLSEQHYKDLHETRTLLDLKNQALKFLLKSPDTYRVELTASVNTINSAPYSIPSTRFEYVDNTGTYHSHYRSIECNKIEVVSTNAETAVFKVMINKNRPIYWILNKADETVAEIPEELFCHRGTKVCELKENN
jgi:hypothetical protein